MYRFIKKLGAFAGFTSIFYFVAVFISGYFFPREFHRNLYYKKGQSGHTLSRLQEADTTGKIDLLFIGSSHAYRGFDTRIFAANHYRAFNLGTSSQTSLQSYVLLRKYLEKMNPERVIIEVNPESFVFDGVESGVDLLSNDDIGYHWLKTVFQINDIRTYNTLIYKTWTQILGIDRGMQEPDIYENDRYVPGGYVEKLGPYHDFQTDSTRAKMEMKPLQTRSFECIIRYLKARNQKYILVQAPVWRKYEQAYINYDDFVSYMARFGDYYDFNKVRQYPRDLFYDDLHLTQPGVRLFNEDLIAFLRDK